MATKTVSTALIIILVILAIPTFIGIAGGIFGIVMGVFGAVFGVFTGIIGGIAGLIGGVFSGLFGVNFFAIFLVAIILILITKRDR